MRNFKKYSLAALAVLLPLAIVVYYYFNYGESGDFKGSQCTIRMFTGLDCPGCGTQRSLHALLHGHISDAIRYNVLFVLGLPFLVYLYYYLIQIYVFKNEKFIHKSVLSSRGVYIFLAVMVVYMILRNIPFEPFIYLSASN